MAISHFYNGLDGGAYDPAFRLTRSLFGIGPRKGDDPVGPLPESEGAGAVSVHTVSGHVAPDEAAMTCAPGGPGARHTGRMDVLLVVATHAEAERLSGLPARVRVCGVGPVAAALATQAALLAGPRPDLVLSAGIGGAFVHGAGLRPGMVAVASELLYGDLGAWDGGEFLGLARLGLSVYPDGPDGFGPNPGRFPAWTGSRALASRLGLACGPFVTVSGATGSAGQAAALLRRVPGALVEGMEGAGVAQAAALCGVPCTELRGVSNMVGPRDRAGWQPGLALDALRAALEAALPLLSAPAHAQQRPPAPMLL